jgi:hypothetical protein
MGILISLLVAATSFAAPSPHSAATLSAVVERGVFVTELSAFPSYVREYRREYTELDWTTDYCSAPLVGNTGRSFNFRIPCQRHDFAYRNMKLLGRFDEVNRKRADEQFLADMRTTCTPRGISQRFNCYAWAETFYAAVRSFGG